MKRYSKSEWARAMIGEHFMEANKEHHVFIEEEHNHVPGMKNWIPVTYYFNNFWKVDLLVQELEDSSIMATRLADVFGPIGPRWPHLAPAAPEAIG